VFLPLAAPMAATKAIGDLAFLVSPMARLVIESFGN
jgi:hypothetical protein